MISIHGDGAELRATAQTRPCLRVARATHPTIRDSTQCYTALECAAICASTQCYNVLLHSAMMCSHTVLQCAAMCFHTVLQCATVCYSMLQCALLLREGGMGWEYVDQGLGKVCACHLAFVCRQICIAQHLHFYTSLNSSICASLTLESTNHRPRQ